MVKNPTLSFLPSFLLSFSFDDFIAYAFPHIVEDLDLFA